LTVVSEAHVSLAILALFQSGCLKAKEEFVNVVPSNKEVYSFVLYITNLPDVRTKDRTKIPPMVYNEKNNQNHRR
jgi:hypothetical protein